MVQGLGELYLNQVKKIYYKQKKNKKKKNLKKIDKNIKLMGFSKIKRKMLVSIPRQIGRFEKF